MQRARQTRSHKHVLPAFRFRSFAAPTEGAITFGRRLWGLRSNTIKINGNTEGNTEG